MLRPLLFSLLLSLPAGAVFAQKHTTEFQLDAPKVKVSNSLYNSIQLLDMRDDTTNLGGVRTGHTNRREQLLANPSLHKQLRIVLSELLDSTTAQSGELLLRLRHLRFSEITGGYSEIGYCQLGAELFSKKDGGYQLLDTLNTTIRLEKTADITAPVLSAGSERLTSFLARALPKTAGGRVYSYADVVNIDSFMKRALPVYNAAIYKDGLYRSYDAFVAQIPDAPVRAEIKEGQLKHVWILTADGEKYKRPNRNEIYSVVYDGRPYIATEWDFYLLKKEQDDFVYRGKMRVGSNDAAMGTAGMFGLAGALIGLAVSPKTNEFYEMKIDYRSGRPVPVRKID